MKTKMVPTQTIHDGAITDRDREAIATELRSVMADTYTLYLKTHQYHWNVTGIHFPTLHQLFEEHYTDMWHAVDGVAERIRTLGHYAPGTFRELSDAATVAEDLPGQVPDSDTMVANLVQGHETVAATVRRVLKRAAKADDHGTVDLLTGRLRFHEKTAWILRSMLQSS